MRSAIYTRISRDRVGAGLGVERQLTDCQELAGKLGATSVMPYEDNDMSAYSGKPRPGYRRMLADIEAGLIDVVLAWHTDRLHRSPVELEEYITACETRGVPTHTVKAGPLDLATPSGRMVARTLGNIARYEVEHMVERQRAAKKQAAAAGKYRGGPRPYGYQADGMTVRPSEAAEVLTMTRNIVAGMSIRAITKSLTDRGVLTATGKPWRQTRVVEIVKRPRNAGLIDVDGPAALWPAIVPEDTWRAALAVLGAPGRQTNPVVARRWLGGGLYRCGVCKGHGVDQVLRATVGAHHRVYVCDGPVRHLTRQAVATDDLVERVMIATLSRPDAAAIFVPPADDGSALHLTAKGIRARMDEAAELFAAGTITGKQLADINLALRNQLEAVDRQIAATTRTNAVAALVTSSDVGKAWRGYHLDQRRAIIAAICQVVVMPAKRGQGFDPEAIEFHWH